MDIKTTYENCKTLINAGRLTKDAGLPMLSLFLMVGAISNDQYVELTGLLNPAAAASTTADSTSTTSTAASTSTGSTATA